MRWQLLLLPALAAAYAPASVSGALRCAAHHRSPLPVACSPADEPPANEAEAAIPAEQRPYIGSTRENSLQSKGPHSVTLTGLGGSACSMPPMAAAVRGVDPLSFFATRGLGVCPLR